MNNSGPNARNLRLLVAIASYGEKQLEFLKTAVRNYQGMAMDVDVVVFSEAPKNLGAGVEVIVGLPSRNPWTLPFAHKPVFAQRVDQYDVFIYSEDDIGFREAQIHAFLKATSQLASDEIAGFLRYEVDESGKRFVTEPWGHYHWKPESVRRRGDYTIAEFTNEHTGFYILTHSQLKRAVASGGFLRGPCRGRYSWPETAATDPYTNCGFRKVICISALEDFLVHHMPNRYVNVLPVSLDSFKEQVRTLFDIRDGVQPACTLGAVEPKLSDGFCCKNYYEQPSETVLGMVPENAQNILSIGCGWGATEAVLKKRGAEVTAVPLDSVIGAVAARQGIEVICGAWSDCLKSLAGRRFNCVLLTNLLHFQPDPGNFIEQCSNLVEEGGVLLLAGPNFDRIPWYFKHHFGSRKSRNMLDFKQSGVSICGPGTLEAYIRKSGLEVTSVQWLNHTLQRGVFRGKQISLGSFTARDWILQARRLPQRKSCTAG